MCDRCVEALAKRDYDYVDGKIAGCVPRDYCAPPCCSCVVANGLKEMLAELKAGTDVRWWTHYPDIVNHDPPETT